MLGDDSRYQSLPSRFAPFSPGWLDEHEERDRDRTRFRKAMDTLLADVASEPAAVDTRSLSVSSILSYPLRDHDKDYVHTDGLDFTPHARHPIVDYEHSRTEIGAHPIAWCRESLDKPGAPYSVKWGRDMPTVEIDGELYRVPVGTAYFDPRDRVSLQTFALVERGKLPGTSLEFVGVPGQFEEIGYSTLSKRPAWEFHKAKVLRYSFCATPVNKGCLHVVKSVDALVPVVETGRISPSGERLDPGLHRVLKSALAAHYPRLRGRE